MDLAADLKADALEGLYVRGWQTMLGLPRGIQTGLYALNRLFPWGFMMSQERAIRRSLPAACAFLRTDRPDAIVSTHWGCTRVLDRARRAEGMHIPLYYVYTELAGAEWPVLCGADRYFCLTDEAEEALVSVRVPRERIVRVGLVVRPELYRDLPPRQEARRALNLRDDTFTVLFSLGGEGIGKTIPFLDHFSTHARQAQILAVTGRNSALLEELEKRYPPRQDRSPVVSIGFLDSLRLPFAAADALAGKCGGSFAVEAIATGRPLLVTRAGAPNEADNRDYMVKHGRAMSTERPADFTAAIEGLAAGGTVGAFVRDGAVGGFRMTGAADIAGFVLEGLQGRG
jgi:UDP-N-acetylglucosamine:LPS N-acetylglucosamine transferase